MKGGDKVGYTSTEVKARYNAKAYDTVKISIPKGDKDRWKALAEQEGLSLTAFIRKKVEGG